ncbi:hypothetical protein T492DRAFT_180967 [Pavlovales sp. CCMP2436]|nr:hypothetical protein T492DRAFT_180967 [Pavlovales sp. CCMP2436]
MCDTYHLQGCIQTTHEFEGTHGACHRWRLPPPCALKADAHTTPQAAQVPRVRWEARGRGGAAVGLAVVVPSARPPPWQPSRSSVQPVQQELVQQELVQQERSTAMSPRTARPTRHSRGKRACRGTRRSAARPRSNRTTPRTATHSSRAPRTQRPVGAQRQATGPAAAPGGQSTSLLRTRTPQAPTERAVATHTHPPRASMRPVAAARARGCARMRATRRISTRRARGEPTRRSRSLCRCWRCWAAQQRPAARGSPGANPGAARRRERRLRTSTGWSLAQ